MPEYHDLDERDDEEPRFCAVCLADDHLEIREWFCMTCSEWFCLRHAHRHHPHRLDPATITLGPASVPIDN